MLKIYKMTELTSILCRKRIANVLMLWNRKFCELKSPVQCKIGIVTGGATGIGYAFVEALLRCGLKGVMIGDVLENEGKEAVKKLCEQYGKNKASFLKADVSVREDMENLFKSTKKMYKQLDIVINNAAIQQDKYWEKEIDVNMKGTIHGTLLGFEYMGKHRDGGGGTIVNVASIYGLQKAAGCPVYSGTNHFVIRFSEAFSHHYYEKLTGVKVFTICPGITDTNMAKLAPTLPLDGFQDLGKILTNEFADLPTEATNVCGCCLMKILYQAVNGSMFVIEDSECYQIKLPNRQTLRVWKPPSQ